MSRLELRDGQWAEMRDWLTHGEEKAVMKAWAAASKDIEDAPDVDTALVRAYVSEWRVLGRDGHEVPLDKPEEASGNVIDAISRVAAERWTNRRADPNPPGG